MITRKLLRLASSAQSARKRHERDETLTYPHLVRARQRLGTGERMFVALHRFTPTTVSRVVALDGVIPTHDLQQALLSLQTRHPLLRATLLDEGPGYFVLEEPGTIRLEVIRRQSDDHWQDVLTVLLNTRIPYTEGPLFEVHYLRAPNSQRSELILVGDHSVCDGVSLNQLMTELLERCTQTRTRPPRSRAPVVDDLLSASRVSDTARGFGAALARFARVALQRTLNETRVSGATSVYTCAQLDAEQTAALMKRARHEKTTVTGALMAAVMLAVRRERLETPRLALSTPVNLRPRLPASTLTDEDLGNYTTAIYLETEASGAPWELARTLKTDLDRDAAETDLLSAAPLVYMAGTRLVRPKQPTLAHAMVSNSGVVRLAREYGHLRVRALYSGTSAPMVSADYCFFCNTFDGELVINLVTSPEVVEGAQAARVLEHVRTVLVSITGEAEA